ncbi:hypothetical protein [Cytobacillus purgationiresistens]|uniref:Uncharacterized protein n=1 Tax=Cytobacillus purgationiresistens TaxID=863449 RepID=A0ABU0AI10_9BACI|nr:hypothetical protein [Cytobacillus purgationiresistens]MDQ0270880.1 hypothetical protein [Cytobacillus purgationiresistens]
MYPYYYSPYCQPYGNTSTYHPNQPPIYPAPAFRSFPSVDPSMFIHSAKEMEGLMKSASALLTKMAESRQFSYELMTAAQQSKITKVESLIKSTGVSNIPKVTYTPDGLRLNFESKADKNAGLSLKLKWM